MINLLHNKKKQIALFLHEAGIGKDPEIPLSAYSSAEVSLFLCLIFELCLVYQVHFSVKCINCSSLCINTGQNFMKSWRNIKKELESSQVKRCVSITGCDITRCNMIWHQKICIWNRVECIMFRFSQSIDESYLQCNQCSGIKHFCSGIEGQCRADYTPSLPVQSGHSNAIKLSSQLLRIQYVCVKKPPQAETDNILHNCMPSFLYLCLYVGACKQTNSVLGGHFRWSGCQEVVAALKQSLCTILSQFCITRFGQLWNLTRL